MRWRRVCCRALRTRDGSGSEGASIVRIPFSVFVRLYIGIKTFLLNPLNKQRVWLSMHLLRQRIYSSKSHAERGNLYLSFGMLFGISTRIKQSVTITTVFKEKLATIVTLFQATHRNRKRM